MNYATVEFRELWTRAWIVAHPVRFFGVLVHLLLRTLFAIFWLAAGINKVESGWLTTNYLEQVFLDRLTEIPPDAFAAMYLQTFGVPFYVAVAWVVTIGEIYSAIGLLLGWTTRTAAAVSFFILLNIGIGGYYDASLIPFFILNAAFLYWNSGLWLGVDRYRALRQ